jgi:hypothetical protein
MPCERCHNWKWGQRKYNFLEERVSEAHKKPILQIFPNRHCILRRQAHLHKCGLHLCECVMFMGCDTIPMSVKHPQEYDSYLIISFMGVCDTHHPNSWGGGFKSVRKPLTRESDYAPYRGEYGWQLKEDVSPEMSWSQLHQLPASNNLYSL